MPLHHLFPPTSEPRRLLLLGPAHTRLKFKFRLLFSLGVPYDDMYRAKANSGRERLEKQPSLRPSSCCEASSTMSEAAAPATAPVKGVTSAYMFFQADQYANHKESFAAGLALGQQGGEISRRWRSLSPEERAKFDALAAKDRERHQAESEARDAEIAARQEANRAARLADPASNGYMRERAAVEPKERKVTREEDMSEERLEARRQLKEKREAQKAARLAAEAESERQKDSIAAAAAATARKR